MNKLTAILVDDEESARDVLENLLKRFCPEIELIDKCQNVEEAVESIKQHKPKIVFLDIEMPNYAGHEIIDFFDEIDFEMIFVTAYDKYAIRAFEVSAVDYLLKPVDIERLQQSVQKASNAVGLKETSAKIAVLNQTLKTNQLKNIIISDKGYQELIPINSIIAIEAQESYSQIHCESEKYIVSKNLKHYERIFEETNNFIRVHKSWIINCDHIINYSKSELTINLSNSLCAKLSKYKKADFEDYIAGEKVH